jgi:hypothetical protein
VLDLKPKKFHECYYSWKSVYALNVMVVCDDKKHVIFYLARWPGSTHDDRVFRNSRLFQRRNEYFDYGDYLLGDSTYSFSSIMVQVFKKHTLPGHLSCDKSLFNTHLV